MYPSMSPTGMKFSRLLQTGSTSSREWKLPADGSEITGSGKLTMQKTETTLALELG